MKLVLIFCLIISVVYTKELNGTITIYNSQRSLFDSFCQELENAEERWNITGNSPYIQKASGEASWWYFFKSTIELDNIKIASAKLNSENFNSSELNVNLNENTNYGYSFNGKNIFFLEFEFDYSYITSFSQQKGKGKISVMSTNTIVGLHHQIKTTDKHRQGSIFSVVVTNFDTITSSMEHADSYLAGLANKALLVTLSDAHVIPALNSVIEKEIDNYFENNSESILTIVSFYEKPIDTHIEISLNNVNQITVLDGQKGFITYHSGEVSNNTYPNTNIDRPTWNQFNPDDGQRQIFLSQDLFADILNEATQEEKAYIKFESKEDEYIIDARGLSNIWPGKIKIKI